MNTKVFSDDEQIRRVWDMEEVKDLMARRAYLYMQDMRREELETLWVRQPELKASAVFGSNWGFFYRGFPLAGCQNGGACGLFLCISNTVNLHKTQHSRLCCSCYVTVKPNRI